MSSTMSSIRLSRSAAVSCAVNSSSCRARPGSFKLSASAQVDSSPNLLAELSTWADALNLNEPGRARQLEELTAQLTAALRDKRMLLIVDDIWQVEHATPFKVGGQGCAMLMTSRLNDVALALAPTPRDVYRLPVLAEEKALELLYTLA